MDFFLAMVLSMWHPGESVSTSLLYAGEFRGYAHVSARLLEPAHQTAKPTVKVMYMCRALSGSSVVPHDVQQVRAKLLDALRVCSGL